MDSYIEGIARVCHEANKGWCEQHGDFSQVSWNDAPEWQRDSCRKGVEFRLANPDAPVSANHQSWFDHKKREGWVYGPVKDAEAKTHPCMVPFEELPEFQQKKDAIFTAIVLALR